MTHTASATEEKKEAASCLQKNHLCNQERNISCICNKGFVRLWIDCDESINRRERIQMS